MNTAIPIRRTTNQMRFLVLLAVLVLCDQSFAADWPQFRGPQRDGVSHEANLLKSWPEGGPKLLWLSTNLGAGYSSPAVVGRKLYTIGQRGGAQWLLCLDAKDGKEIWATRLGDPYAKEISRFELAPQSERRALKAKVWTPPVIAHGRLYLRDQEYLLCYQISLEAVSSKTANSRQP